MINSIDDSICLEESLFDDSGSFVAHNHKQLLNLSSQNLEELNFEPDCVDPETFLLKANEKKQVNSSTLSQSVSQQKGSFD